MLPVPVCYVVFGTCTFKVLDARAVFMGISLGYLYDRLDNLFNPFRTMNKSKKSILDQFGQSLYPFHHELLLRTFYLEQLSMYAAFVIVVFTSQLFLCCTRREGEVFFSR